jgi:hypothetical protein
MLEVCKRMAQQQVDAGGNRAGRVGFGFGLDGSDSGSG